MCVCVCAYAHGHFSLQPLVTIATDSSDNEFSHSYDVYFFYFFFSQGNKVHLFIILQHRVGKRNASSSPFMYSQTKASVFNIGVW